MYAAVPRPPVTESVVSTDDLPAKTEVGEIDLLGVAVGRDEAFDR